MYKSIFDRWFEAMSKTADCMLQFQFQKNMMKQNLLNDREIDVIADRVIQRLHITADVSQVIMSIDEIKDRMNNLGKN